MLIAYTVHIYIYGKPHLVIYSGMADIIKFISWYNKIFRDIINDLNISGTELVEPKLTEIE